MTRFAVGRPCPHWRPCPGPPRPCPRFFFPGSPGVGAGAAGAWSLAGAPPAPRSPLLPRAPVRSWPRSAGAHMSGSPPADLGPAPAVPRTEPSTLCRAAGRRAQSCAHGAATTRGDSAAGRSAPPTAHIRPANRGVVAACGQTTAPRPGFTSPVTPHLPSRRQSNGPVSSSATLRRTLPSPPADTCPSLPRLPARHRRTSPNGYKSMASKRVGQGRGAGAGGASSGVNKRPKGVGGRWVDGRGGEGKGCTDDRAPPVILPTMCPSIVASTTLWRLKATAWSACKWGFRGSRGVYGQTRLPRKRATTTLSQSNRLLAR